MTNLSELRNLLQQAVLSDLPSPATGTEELVDARRVGDCYLIGRLGPQG